MDQHILNDRRVRQNEAQREAEKLAYVRRALQRKIPKLIAKIERRIAKGQESNADVIVPGKLDRSWIVSEQMLESEVNQLLIEAGSPAIKFWYIDSPSNYHALFPSGFFTHLYVRYIPR